MYVTYCKLSPLSSIITENVPNVCKPLQVMSFTLSSVIFVVKSDQMDPTRGYFGHLLSYGVHLIIFNHKNTLMWGPFGQI
ncbi:hypothetical protein Hanom_Chr02g00159761 [Helianthus anomalus]